jgi:hypothetical protein
MIAVLICVSFVAVKELVPLLDGLIKLIAAHDSPASIGQYSMLTAALR